MPVAAPVSPSQLSLVRILNKSDLAAPLGMSVPGIGRWLDILETTAQVLIVPPYFEKLGKRLIKSPKVYLADSGLACHLLGIETEVELKKSPFLGALFETNARAPTAPWKCGWCIRPRAPAYPRGPSPKATYFGTIGGVFVSGAAQAARFSDCNTGLLAPCRYKVSGIGLAPFRST